MLRETSCLIKSILDLQLVSRVRYYTEDIHSLRGLITITGDNLHFIRKPEHITDLLRQNRVDSPGRLMFEVNELTYQEY